MFLIDSDRIRMLTENLVTLDGCPPIFDHRSACRNIRAMLPDFDHPPEGQQFAEACHGAAWAIYCLRYADEQDNRGNPATGGGGWSGRMRAKYGQEMTRWPLPGFPGFRAAVDVGRLIGVWERYNHADFLRLCLTAYGTEYRPGEPAYQQWDKVQDSIYRMLMQTIGHGVGLEDDEAMADALSEHEQQAAAAGYNIPEDVLLRTDFGRDWLPVDLSDCGVPVMAPTGCGCQYKETCHPTNSGST